MQTIEWVFNKVYRRYFYKNNLISDSVASIVTFEDIESGLDIPVQKKNFESGELMSWLASSYPEYANRFACPDHKKLLEFFVSASLLKPESKHTFMDAAGGKYSYIKYLNCKKRIIQDIRITNDLREELGDEISYVSSDAGGYAN